MKVQGQNPDELSALIPDESNTDGDTNVNPDEHDSEELYPEQEDEKKESFMAEEMCVPE